MVKRRARFLSTTRQVTSSKGSSRRRFFFLSSKPKKTDTSGRHIRKRKPEEELVSSRAFAPSTLGVDPTEAFSTVRASCSSFLCTLFFSLSCSYLCSSLLHSPASALISPLRFLSSQRESLVLSSSSPHYSFLPPSPGSRKKRYHDEIGQALLRYGTAAAVARLHLRLRLGPAKGRVRLAVCGPQRRSGHMEEERDVPPALRRVCHDAQRDRRLQTCPGGALGAQGGDRRLRRRARLRRRGARDGQDQPRRQGWHPPRARDAHVGLRRRQGQGQSRRRRRSGQRCPRGELP